MAESYGRPMLGYLIRRLEAVPSLHGIVVATTTNADDDVIQAFAEKVGVLCFRGSESDVMGRVLGAATAHDADVIVEITGDCPIIDPDIVEQVVRIFLANDAAYVGNAHRRSYPDGMDTQVFARQTLATSASITTRPLDREHVTLHIRDNPELFPPIHLVAPPSLHWPDLGLTLDERQDFELLDRIIGHFGPATPLFGCLDVVRLLRRNPDWVSLNADVHRKGDT